MDSKLVSMVRNLEDEAERSLAEAKDRASVILRENKSSQERLAQESEAKAKNEAEQLLQASRKKTQEDMERISAEAKASMVALLRRAEARLEKASRLILDRLGKP